MKQKKKTLKGVKDFGVTIKVNKDLDKYSNKVLFPEQLELANKILTNMKFTYIKIK